MVIKSYSKKTSLNEMDLTCDSCHSNEIVETEQGYVCPHCGLVLKIPRMEYDKPYIQKRIQHEVSFGNTYIGHQKERIRDIHSTKLERLQKIQNIKSNGDYVNQSAKIEISRLLTGLSLSRSFKDPIFKMFKEIRKKLQKGTKYRNPEKLLPTLLYFHFKKEGIVINEPELLEISKVEKKDYNYCKLKISRLIPEYYERNRKQFIMNKVLGLSEQYNLGMEFYYDAKRVLINLWEGIKCTTDNVIAGLISSVAVLCNYRNKITISSICSALNIQMSTIQSQVKRKLFERFNVPGFESLVKSADLVKTIVYKLGIFESIESTKSEANEEKEQKDVSIVIEIDVDVKFEAALREKQFIFAIESANYNPICILMKIRSNHQKKEIKKKQSKYQKQIRFQKIVYHYPTGPPTTRS